MQVLHLETIKRKTVLFITGVWFIASFVLGQQRAVSRSTEDEKAALQQYDGTIIDVHVYASIQSTMVKKFSDIEKYKITHGAISGPWSLMEQVRAKGKGKFLYGLMFPCPNNFAYTLGAKCFDTGNEYPDTVWVKKQIEEKRIDFIGELLNQYYGISPSDSSLDPYYRLAERCNLPVGVHLGLADPGSVFKWAPNFKASLGNPLLLEDVVKKYPKLRVWIMHAGHPYSQELLALMWMYPQVYVDIAAIASNAPFKNFYNYMKTLVDAGLEDRIMYGSDGEVAGSVKAINDLDFLTLTQKEKIFKKNAIVFFGY